MRGFAISGVLIAFLAVCAGLIVLQFFLSKQQNRWPGLILPIISFGISLLMTLSILGMTVGTISTTRYDEFGQIISSETIYKASTGSLVIQVIFVLLLTNIPTAILMAIYGACRGNIRRKRNLDKMNAQDLE